MPLVRAERRTVTQLQDEETKASGESLDTEASTRTAGCTATGRTTAEVYHRRQRLRAAKTVWFSHAPVVRIEVVRPCWPLFGRQTTLNAATYCAPVSSISAGQQSNGQAAGARDTVYGSDGQPVARAQQVRRNGLGSTVTGDHPRASVGQPWTRCMQVGPRPITNFRVVRGARLLVSLRVESCDHIAMALTR